MSDKLLRQIQRDISVLIIEISSLKKNCDSIDEKLDNICSKAQAAVTKSKELPKRQRSTANKDVEKLQLEIEQLKKARAQEKIDELKSQSVWTVLNNIKNIALWIAAIGGAVMVVDKFLMKLF